MSVNNNILHYLLLIMSWFGEPAVVSRGVVHDGAAIRREKIIVKAGERSILPVSLIDIDSAWVAVSIRGRNSEYRLTDTHGMDILPKDRNVVFVDRDSRIEEFLLAGSYSEPIQIELQAGESEEAQLELVLRRNDGFRIQLSIDPVVCYVGDSVSFSVALIDEKGNMVRDNNLEWVVAIAPPGKKEQTIELLDDGRNGDGLAGDGQWGRYIQLSMSGVHTIRARCLHRAGDNRIEQDAEANLLVRDKEGPRFTGQHQLVTLDDNNNGLWDQLVVKLQIQCPKGSRVQVLGRLESASGQVIAPQLSMMSFNSENSGSFWVTLELSSDLLVRSQQEGPWVLKNIRLWDLNGKKILDQMADVVISDYRLNQFDRPLPPTISSVSCDDSKKSMVIHGKKFGGARRVLIGEKEYSSFVIDDSHVIKNQILISKPREMRDVDWEKLCSQLGTISVEVETPWGRAVYPKESAESQPTP